jgi:hypothetical protein
MSVPEDIYFGYMIPANLALFVGLHFFFRKNSQSALFYLERAKEYVSDKLRVGIIFVVIALAAGFFLNMVPKTLTYIFYLLADLCRWLLYLFFS